MNSFYSLYSWPLPFPESLYALCQQPELQNQFISSPLSNIQYQQSTQQKCQIFKPILLQTCPTAEALPENKRKSSKKTQGQLPHRQNAKKKDENFGWRNQNKDRNVISSILKSYVHLILQKRGMVKLIEDVAKKLEIKNAVSSFYEFMTEKFKNKKSYVGIQFMQKVLTSAPSTTPMTYILSVTLSHYLKEDYPLTIIQDLKLKRKNRLSLKKQARLISAKLFKE